jgi:hypothetical protein
MSNETTNSPNSDEMANEYDFSQKGAIRGKYAHKVRDGYKVAVHKTDGTTEERDFTLPQGVIALDPDVQAYFPDSDAVNRALRGLINLIPKQKAS